MGGHEHQPLRGPLQDHGVWCPARITYGHEYTELRIRHEGKLHIELPPEIVDRLHVVAHSDTEKPHLPRQGRVGGDHLIRFVDNGRTLLAAEAERYVAVVITSSRVFGLGAETTAFNEITLRKNETRETLKLTYNKATVRTSDRLLTFESSGTTWKEHRLY